MAIIGEIQKKGVLLLVIIGLAMAAFVLGDMFRGGSSGDYEIGSIHGDMIDGRDFENRVEYEVDKATNLGSSISRDQVRDQVWSDMLREMVLGREMEALGLVVPRDELIDQIEGDNLHEFFRNQESFKNPQTGQIDRNRIRGWLQQNAGNPIINDVETFIRQDRMESKYYNLIRNGVFITDLEAKRMHTNQNRKANFSYVLRKYFAIADSAVKVTDSDLKAYYDAHKHEKSYDQKEARSFDFVIFAIEPSDEDHQALKQELESMKAKFAAAEDDSLFVIDNSHSRTISEAFLTQDKLPYGIDTVIFALDTGAVYGPYEEAGYYKLSKVKEIAFLPDSVEARHILIKANPQEKPADLEARADSLIEVIKSKKNFADLATNMSEDLGSAEKGGDLGWFGPGQMVPTFNDYCFNGKTGDIGRVTSQFGMHIIEITNQKGAVKNMKLYSIDREIAASRATLDNVYREATGFAANNGTQELFEKSTAAEGGKYGKREAIDVKLGQQYVAGLSAPGALIRWAYSQDAEIGSVSSPITLEDKYVVACLTKIKEEGRATLKDKEDEIRIKVLKEKKAELVKSQMTGFNSLNEVAAAVGEKVLYANGVSLNTPSISGGGGTEPEVVGRVFGLKPEMVGKMTEPIAGEIGVYVIQLNEFVEAIETTDYTEYKNTAKGAFASQAEYAVFEALKEIARVKDNRARFY